MSLPKTLSAVRTETFSYSLIKPVAIFVELKSFKKIAGNLKTGNLTGYSKVVGFLRSTLHSRLTVNRFLQELPTRQRVRKEQDANSSRLRTVLPEEVR